MPSWRDDEDDRLGRGEVVRSRDALGGFDQVLGRGELPRYAVTVAWAASVQACQNGWSVSPHSRAPSSAADTAVDQCPRRSADHDSSASVVPRVCNLASERNASAAWVNSVSEMSNAPARGGVPELVSDGGAVHKGACTGDDFQDVVDAVEW